MHRPTENDYRRNHRLHVLASLAVSLALVVAAVRLWPAAGPAADEPLRFDTRAREVIAIEEVQPTAQGESAPPPPPAPAPPVVVPDDVVLEEDELDLDVSENLIAAEPGDRPPGPVGPAGPPAGPRSVQPEVGPKTVRFVEPEYTREARRRKIRAEVVVEVRVDERGRVTESRIVERFLLGKDAAEKQPVAEVGYGLEEAALSAAGRWIFRPARQDGRPVASYTTLTFTFGV